MLIIKAFVMKESNLDYNLKECTTEKQLKSRTEEATKKCGGCVT